MSPPDWPSLVSQFRASYDEQAKDRIWAEHSQKFQRFWKNRVLSPASTPISDDDCDEIVKILDRNGKGNTKDSEAVARAMVAQGAWRRMFNEFHSNIHLARLITRIFESEGDARAKLIDELYKVNEKQKNHLTGPSANVINALLAAHDPATNLSVISLKDRHSFAEFFDVALPFKWDAASIGRQIVATNEILLRALRKVGVTGSARTASRFCYFPPVAELWKGKHSVRRVDKDISVIIPTESEGEEDIRSSQKDEIRESMQMQALIAKVGADMGFTIWLPKADRGRVLKAWQTKPGQLLDELPLGYDSSTMRTIEQIDVLWLNKRSIVRAFEVEHTTSVYSGLLRMADLVALQPNINIKLHIVAPASKRDKVMQEIQRPVFSLLGERALSDICTYLSYDSFRSLGGDKHLAYLKDQVIEDYEESAD